MRTTLAGLTLTGERQLFAFESPEGMPERSHG
jgi:hypothetical protein